MTFTETQKFAPAILWLVRILPALIATILSIAFLGANIPTYQVLIIFAISLAPMLLLIPLFELTRLKTKIDKSGIHMSFKPFSQKQYAWDDIESAELIDYGFVGGWGIRKSRKYGTVYNTQGSKGVWLKLKNGKKVVIGTQRTAELKRVLTKTFPTT